MDTLDHQIADALARLGFADEFLVTPATPPAADGSALVALHDNQATTVFRAEALLEVLRALPAGTPYEPLWQAMLPCMVAE